MAGEADIAAIGIVRAPPEEVFGFLADLENHWRLGDRFIVVVNLKRGPDGRARGGRVRMRGPLGLSRTAATSVLAADAPERMLGVAEIGGRTRAFVRWKLSGVEGGTRVRLDATIDRTGWVDRLLLLLGGRTWLERRFSAVLQRLGERFSSAAVDDERYTAKPTRMLAPKRRSNCSVVTPVAWIAAMGGQGFGPLHAAIPSC